MPRCRRRRTRATSRTRCLTRSWSRCRRQEFPYPRGGPRWRPPARWMRTTRLTPRRTVRTRLRPQLRSRCPAAGPVVVCRMSAPPGRARSPRTARAPGPRHAPAATSARTARRATRWTARCRPASTRTGGPSGRAICARPSMWTTSTTTRTTGRTRAAGIRVTVAVIPAMPGWRGRGTTGRSRAVKDPAPYPRAAAACPQAAGPPTANCRTGSAGRCRTTALAPTVTARTATAPVAALTAPGPPHGPAVATPRKAAATPTGPGPRCPAPGPAIGPPRRP